MQRLKGQNGITLIALIITIIVMLILVGVTISVSLNGGLFTTAKEAVSKTQIEADRESLLSAVIGEINDNGEVDFDKLDNNLPEGFTGTKGTYTSKAGNTFMVSENGAITLIGETGGEGSGDDDNNPPEVTVPATYKTSITGLANTVTFITYENLASQTTAKIKSAVDAGKISAVLKETITLNGVSTEAIAVIPTGYIVSTTDGEDSISQGLVIYDGTSDTNRNNEFVWVPVAGNFEPIYNYSSDYSEPTTVFDDTQTDLNTYYGTNHYTIDTGDTYQNNVNNTFAYKAHYAEMVESVNDYKGYYIGRYETTIDGNSIGSKAGATVLTADKTLEQTNNKEVRWWGLYDVQRNSNVAGNGSIVQTNMIWGQQWDTMLSFIGVNSSIEETQIQVLPSGTATYSGTKDEMNNIFDLRRNAREWTAEADDTDFRTSRGGYYDGGQFVSYRSYSDYPYLDLDFLSSRLALYIK